jgi:hypothetical protein
MEEEVKEPQEVQVSEVEQEAMALGWKPEEDFKADPANENKKWRTAEDFMDRKSLFDKIDSYSRKVKDLERGINSLSQHNAKIEQSAYERALRELRSERKEALENGDVVLAEEIRDRIDEVKEQQRTVVAQPQQPAVHPEFVAFVDRNRWYETDPDMRAYADGYAQQLMSQGIRDPEKALPMLERKVREVFAGKFRNPNKDRAPVLEGGKGKVKSDSFVLTPDEEKIMTNMIRAGVPLSKEDYIAQIKNTRK